MRPEHGIYRDEREQPSQRKQLRRGTALLIAKLTIWSFHFTVAEARMKRLDCSQNAIITMSANQRNKPSRSSSLSTQCNYQTVSTSLTIWTLGGRKKKILSQAPASGAGQQKWQSLFLPTSHRPRAGDLPPAQLAFATAVLREVPRTQKSKKHKGRCPSPTFLLVPSLNIRRERPSLVFPSF